MEKQLSFCLSNTTLDLGAALKRCSVHACAGKMFPISYDFIRPIPQFIVSTGDYWPIVISRSLEPAR